MENTPQDTPASKGKRGPKPKEMVTAEYQGLPVGRDKKVIDPSEVEKLAALGCRDREIADFLGIAEDTLRRNFADNLIKGKENMKITLRRAMLHNACVNHSAAVQIFLAKNILGMADTPVSGEGKAPLPWSDDEE
ncbi:hypothetical protein UFOVP635_2 [uncultured Caudovirales phage]|uniref:Uncharacterized protein n=1 Tax=uncultured Caudovirales phage TaxID=2100421 RepID=A0A6J5N426_9CAUD|nr:hypothetical protein UFOVP635_2 [uncultured Caudovirales phage]